MGSPIFLKFSDDIAPPVQARISYAFRVFAAIYGHSVSTMGTEKEAICFFYGRRPPMAANSGCFYVPARYDPSSTSTLPEKLTRHRYAGEEFLLFYDIDNTTQRPDWLGELFVWLSSSHEIGITKRDSIGRIAYGDMVFSKLGISPCKPYATLLMAWMENCLKDENGGENLPRAVSPVAETNHIVVCSQDIDFYYVDRISAFIRLVKNLGIAALRSKNWSFFSSNLDLLAKALTGKRVGDFLPPMLEEMETHGVQSTLFVIPRQGHRRDANYRLEELAPHLVEASKKGFSVELHGSYTSVVDGTTLPQESLRLEKTTGKRTLGNRQHWLRFDRHENLFQEIERAGLVLDSTLGFSDMVGFRNGASFAFPPYDFKNEKAHPFLEIPLVLMDVSLEAASRTLSRNPQDLADEVLEQSRKWGWGGISLLWHNPMEPLHVSKEINHVFWNCMPKKGNSSERWMSTSQFLKNCWGRYQAAGLLGEVPLQD